MTDVIEYALSHPPSDIPDNEEAATLGFPAVNHCVCFAGTEYANVCLCGPTERCMRSYCADWRTMPPWTPEQREWAINEIVYCAEGTERWSAECLTDDQLAKQVLFVWVEFARDKGVL